MAGTEKEVERDRWQVMKELYIAGKTAYAEMLPDLAALGLVECKPEHRKRKKLDGTVICSTCEMTISQQWRRGLRNLSETEADILEVKGAWIEAHEFIRDTCRRRCIRRVTTTKTIHYPKVVDGAEVTVTETSTSVHERVDLGLLRMLATVSDKLARVAGFEVDSAEGNTRTIPVELHVHERSADDIARAATSDKPN